MPGDWHIMKTSAEVLKHSLADGGFKIFAKQSGHKGDMTQWQDIHNIMGVDNFRSGGACVATPNFVTYHSYLLLDYLISPSGVINKFSGSSLFL